MTDEQEQPVKKPISYEPVQDAEVHVECGDSTEEQINYEPKPEAEVFIEKGAKKSEKNEWRELFFIHYFTPNIENKKTNINKTVVNPPFLKYLNPSLDIFILFRITSFLYLIAPQKVPNKSATMLCSWEFFLAEIIKYSWLGTDLKVLKEYASINIFIE